MTYVFTREGYTRVEFLNAEGCWTRHKEEAWTVYGTKSRNVALKEIRKQTSIPIRAIVAR